MAENNLNEAGLADYLTKLLNAKLRGFDTFEDFIANLSQQAKLPPATPEVTTNLHQVGKMLKESGVIDFIKEKKGHPLD